MNLTTVREIYRSRETYLDKEVQIGGWYEACAVPRTLASSL